MSFLDRKPSFGPDERNYSTSQDHHKAPVITPFQIHFPGKQFRIPSTHLEEDDMQEMMERFVIRSGALDAVDQILDRSGPLFPMDPSALHRVKLTLIKLLSEPGDGELSERDPECPDTDFAFGMSDELYRSFTTKFAGYVDALSEHHLTCPPSPWFRKFAGQEIAKQILYSRLICHLVRRPSQFELWAQGEMEHLERHHTIDLVKMLPAARIMAEELRPWLDSLVDEMLRRVLDDLYPRDLDELIPIGKEYFGRFALLRMLYDSTSTVCADTFAMAEVYKDTCFDLGFRSQYWCWSARFYSADCPNHVSPRNFPWSNELPLNGEIFK